MQLDELCNKLLEATEEVEIQKVYVDSLNNRLVGNEATIRVYTDDDVWTEVCLTAFFKMQKDKYESMVKYRDMLSRLKSDLQAQIDKVLSEV